MLPQMAVTMPIKLAHFSGAMPPFDPPLYMSILELASNGMGEGEGMYMAPNSVARRQWVGYVCWWWRCYRMLGMLCWGRLYGCECLKIDPACFMGM